MDSHVGIIRTHWSGTSGGPGLSQFCVVGDTSFAGWDDSIAQTAVDAARTFWDARKSTVPNEVSLVVDPAVDIFDIVSGTLVASYHAATAPATVTGTNSGSYSMASGAKINFRTADILNGRRIRGAVYIVPCGGDVFGNDGSVTSTPRTDWVNSAGTMKNSWDTIHLKHVVWHRPTALGANDGSIGIVTSYDVPTKGAILRGRRD